MEFEKVSAPPEEYVRLDHRELRRFVADVFEKLGVPRGDAEITADVLVTADLRGIESHGVARLKRYVDGLKAGTVNPRPEIRVLRESRCTALIDGDRGLGQVVGYRAMELAIRKAESDMVGVIGVRNSNHYGIAGYYALMAVERKLIGLSMTNSRPLACHTGALGRTIGTNPIALGAPAKTPPPFLLDMATTIVPIGKFETYRRKGLDAPADWAIDEKGEITRDPEVVLRSGALLPLGGLLELTGGHKGYGLSVAVDVLCGLLTGAAWGSQVGGTAGPKPSNVGHFFAALNVEAFMPLSEFLERVDELKRYLKSARKHPKFKEIWVHGERSWLTTQTRLKKGVPVHRKTAEYFRSVSEELGVRVPRGL